MLMITGIGVTVFAADIVLRMALNSGSRNSKDNPAAILFMVCLAFMVFNFLITPLLRMAVSRKREFAADATVAFITRNPKALASALRKISCDSRVEVLDKRKSMAVVCIANPMSQRKFFGDAFATHPKTEERIKRLESM
jgi:heat shock protein HtpX